MPGKYRITKTVTTEAKSLRTRIEIHEGDEAAPVPGGFYGVLSLTDENGNVVERQQLGPEDLDPIAAHVAGLKTRAVADSGAVLVADTIPAEPLEAEVRK